MNELNRAASDMESAARNARAQGLTDFAREYEAEAKQLRAQARAAVQAMLGKDK